jgi:rubrerythrin
VALGDETFDLSVDKPLWLMVSVRDRALVGKHDIVGRAYLCLDPRRFNDFLSHELWMDLDTQGRILVRVSMEGEKDDIQFYFGRAFRSLKRAEADMLRIFIDKVRRHIDSPSALITNFCYSRCLHSSNNVCRGM